MTVPDYDELDAMLAGIRAMQREKIAAQRRKRIIRLLRVLIVIGGTVTVAVVFVWLLLVGVVLVAGAI